MSRIVGLNSSQHAELRKLLSYSLNPQAAYFSGAHNRSASLLDKRGNFPTGLLYLAEKYLKSTRQPIEIIDARKRPKPLGDAFDVRLGVCPYPEQEQASNAALTHSRGIISCPTGTGKSMIAALIISKIKVRTLVVVPSLELKSQLTSTLKAAFPNATVGGLGSDIAVCNVDSLDPSVESDYNAVIIDEFHHSGAKTYRKLNKKAWNGIYHRYGLTATPFRTQDNERLLLESVLSHVIYRLDYQTAVDKGYIAPIQAYYIDLPRTPVKGDTWHKVYNELVVNNNPRNKIVTALMTALICGKKSTLCLVKEIEHGINLVGHMGQDLVFFIQGENDNNREVIDAFNNRKITALIGTTGVVGEGVDTRPTEYVIIAGLGKSKGAFMQQCGRGFRKYPGKESCKIILFKDSSHKWSLAHFKAQVKVLKDEYSVVPVELDISELL